MKILIIGGGAVGATLARQLVSQHLGQRVSLIDKELEICNNLSSRLEIQALHGSGLDSELLIRAGIADTDTIIAVTPNDETNILCCFIAAQFQVPHRIARLTTPYLTKEFINLEELGVTDTLLPETESISHIVEHLLTPELIDIYNFKRAQIALRTFRITTQSNLLGKRVSELAEVTGSRNTLVLSINRCGTTVIPSGETIFELSDEVLVLLPMEHIDDFQLLFKHRREKIGKVIISGESEMAILLAQKVEKLAKSTVLISENHRFCEHCAGILENCEILCGSPGLEDILSDAGIDRADCFISVDSDGDENMVSALLAKSEGASRVIAVTNNEKHFTLFKSLGIDHVIQPSLLSTQQLFRDVTGVSREVLFRHAVSKMELAHFKISPNCTIINRTIAELRTESQADFIVGGVIRNNRYLIVQASTTIQPYDTVLTFFSTSDFKKISKLFKG